jgi:hypothetical protein
MPELRIDFEVYCGICGHGACGDTDVKGDRVTVTCSRCEDKLQEYKDLIEELETRIGDLNQELREAINQQGE